MSEIESKLKKAEKLRKKGGFLSSFFIKPDYSESADLFVEVAKECNSEDKIKYYKEAAETYLLCNSESGFWSAAQCFLVIFEESKNKDFISFLKHIDCLVKIERFMLAGQALCNAAEKVDFEKSIEFLKKSVEVFEKDGNCPYHIKKSMEQLLLLYLKKERISEASMAFSYLDKKYSPKFYKLCIHILNFLENKPNIEDDLETDENEIIMTLINNSDHLESCLNNFMNKNAVPEQVKLVFDLCLNKIRPENDIC